MVEQLRILFDSLGVEWVLWLLLGLSVASIAIMIERWWFFRTNSAPIAEINDALKKALKGAPEALHALDGLEAAVLKEALEHLEDGAESLEETIAAELSLQRTKYDARLSFLGTLGNNAPFIGLFGTVLGIISAFNNLKSGLAGDTGQNELIMGSISEALVATAVGLLVAIPAVIAFNGFKGAIRVRVSNAQSLSHRILAHLKAGHGED